MGIQTTARIPHLHLSQDHYKDKDEREHLAQKIKKACESHGCFLLSCPEIIPSSLRENLLVFLKSLFDLPEETKLNYRNPKPYRSYIGNCHVTPLHQSFGIDEAYAEDVALSFTQLMWPQGNPKFCETIQSMSSKMLELNLTITKLIFETFGLDERLYDSYVENTTSLFRLMKYKIPAATDHVDSSSSSAIGLTAHTDKNAVTVLSQNDVQGLEIVGKDGEWARVVVPQDTFVVFVGDVLKAWSNGRLKAVRHRVVMDGDKERYSFGLFTMPKEGAVVSVPDELVDARHPLVYRPFVFSDYVSYFASNISDDALEVYAGV